MNTCMSCFICVTVVALCFIPTTKTEAKLFDARIDCGVGKSPYSVAVGDLDGDGNPDLVTANGGYLNVSVLLGNGNGTFQAAVNYQTFASPRCVVIRDLDGDGNPDLAVACQGNDPEVIGVVSIHLGNGDGTFQEAVAYEAAWNASWVAIGDLNGDGNPDLAVACQGSDPEYVGSVSILLGNGDGTFQEAVNYVIPEESSMMVAIGDLDGDGSLDLAVASYGSSYPHEGAVSILLGNGDGTFHAAVNYGFDSSPTRVVIGDLDGDSYPDLAVANLDDYFNYVTVLLGNGDGTFQETVHYVVGDNGGPAVAIGDLDGDNNPDLAVVCAGWSNDDTVSVLLGNGDGTFQEAVKYQTSNGPNSLAIGDLDGDSNLDLALANTFSDNVSVLLGVGDGTFQEAVNYGASWGPRSVAIDDLDGDNNLDLAVVNYGDHSVSVLLGIGDGTFHEAVIVSYEVGIIPKSIAIGDLNSDDNPDLAVAGPEVAVLLGNGDGTFQEVVIHEVGNNARSIAIGDLNNDGNPDVAVAGPSVAVLLGNGDGTFQTRVQYWASNYPFSVAIGDLDQNGHPDLAVASDTLDKVFVLLGHGDGTFQAAVDYDAGVEPQSIAIGDLDGDGNPDLAVTNNGSENPYGRDNVTVLLGNGDGSFQAAESHEVGYGPTSVAIGDLDGDINPDLVVTNSYCNNVSLLKGIGDGTFQTAVNYGAGEWAYSVAIGDLDGSGSPDLAVVNHFINTVSVLINITEAFHRVLVGPGPAYENSPLVRVFPPAQDALPAYEFFAYGAQNFGVKVTCGDPDGDGADEILTGAGPGEIYGPHVRGFAVDGTPLPGLNFLAYGTNKYGVNVAAGDLDGDGVDEILTGAGPGAVFGPHVRGWSYTGSTGVTAVPGVSYFAYGTPKWGVNVSAGDIDGDGYDEIVTGAGPGEVYGPHVRGWNVDGGTSSPMSGVSFFAYGTLKYGVNVACGDVDGDGIDEIVTGAGPGAVFGPHVRGWNVDGSLATAMANLSFFAWPAAELRYGANVFSGADLNGNGRDEIVVGQGPDPEAGTWVKVYMYEGSQVTERFSFEAFGDLGLAEGANVAAGKF